MKYIFLSVILILLFFLLFKTREQYTNDYLRYLSTVREIYESGNRCPDLSDKSVVYCEGRKKAKLV